MKHKKIVSLLLVAAMAMSMTACGSKEEAPAADTTTEKTETAAKEEAPAADDAASSDLVTLSYAYSGYGNYPADSVPFLQEILADADPAVMDEIVACYETEPPKWVVLFYNRPFSPPYDARVQEILDTRYEFVDARGQYQLLRLKEAL